MVVPVVVGMKGEDARTLIAAGQSVPKPIATKGVIDTGSNVTCVAARILRQLGLALVKQLTSQTVSGPIQAQLYEVSLSIPQPTTPSGVLLHFDLLTVMEWLPGSPDLEVLIGLDVVSQSLLIVDGRRNEFTLGD